MNQVNLLRICIGMVGLAAAFGQSPDTANRTASGQPSTKNGEWPQYTGDLKGTKYSPLDQINASNFNRWRSPGVSRPITWARVPSTSSKARP